ncbi:MFS transporter [candidate division KSB1 bacterium]|nr:MAG: MFS transporter [candidate division KSB1 bacterium]
MLKSDSNTANTSVRDFFSRTRATTLFRPVIIANIYLFFYFGLSTWLPFFNIYLLDRGFNGRQVGIITGLYQAMLFFVVPVWGMVADRFGNRKTLHITLFGAMLAVLFLRFIPTFEMLTLYMLGFAFLHHPIGMLTDSLAITYVRHSNRVSFGHMRVWGSVSWAIGAVIMGRFLQAHSTATIFQIAPVIYGVTWLIIWLYQKPEDLQRVRVSFRFSELKEIFANKKIIFFLLLLTLFGIGVSPLYIFINLYFRDIGAGNELIGLGFAIMAISEVPFFFLAGSFVKRWGAAKILLLAIATAIVRLGLYSLISNPLIAVFLGLAQGLNFSLFWVVVVEIMHNLVPEQYRATAQSLIWAFHIGGGLTIGNMSIGWLSDVLPMQQVMLLASAFTSVAFIYAMLYFWKNH